MDAESWEYKAVGGLGLVKAERSEEGVYAGKEGGR